MQIFPHEWVSLPFEQKCDKDILLQAINTHHTYWTELGLWLEHVLDEPTVRDDEVLLAILSQTSDQMEVEELMSVEGASEHINPLLENYDSAMELLKSNEFWFNYIKIPITLQVLEKFVQLHRPNAIAMKFSLPSYCLEDAEILRLGARLFRNILTAPEHLLNRDIVAKNVHNGGLEFARLPESYREDGELFHTLLKEGLYGPVYNLLRYQEHFSTEVLYQ